ncbi:MAG: thiolase domain-containing protein [Actinomycetes bacterium]
MRDVAIISFAQTKHAREISDINEVEILMPLMTEALASAGIAKERVDFVCSASSDYLAGQPFSFVMSLDAFGPWPPISESHVDMDGAWAMYEAWVKMQMGKTDIALVYAYGKSSPGNIRRVLSRQLDPYSLGPLWLDSVSIAAMQARLGLDAGVFTEQQIAEVVVDARRHGAQNPFAQLGGTFDVAGLLEEPEFVAPLRKHDCAPVTDGAAVMILAAGDVARELSDRPAWIRGIDHRIEAAALGVRDLTRSTSTKLAAQHARVAAGAVDFAELHAPFAHQELLLRAAIGLDDSVTVNPSGGALCANPIMTAGLVRLGEAAARITRGDGDRAVAHATSGPCLQQNLVCVLEGD